MHVLFPQDAVDTGYADNDFLKVGGAEALPFIGTANLNKKYEIN